MVWNWKIYFTTAQFQVFFRLACTQQQFILLCRDITEVTECGVKGFCSQLGGDFPMMEISAYQEDISEILYIAT